VTKVEAKRYVLRVLATTLQQDRGNGSEWMEQHPGTGATMSDQDQERVLAATYEVEAELRRRGGQS
jgi:hypothetical protein